MNGRGKPSQLSVMILLATLACASCVDTKHASASLKSTAKRPNIVFIMADDLGYGDLGCYGQAKIKTPNLDRMASQGMKFRQFYAGCTVCAPSRSVLMTGQHMGHTHVRGNAAGALQALRPEDITVAEKLREAGYATALCGKWGLGDDLPGARQGRPNQQGFDLFYGYLNQVHAHNYYPAFLWRDTTKETLRNVVVNVGRGGGGFVGGHATSRIDYSHDLVMKEAKTFVRKTTDRPFFLYLALTIPHANNEGTRATGNGQEVPDFGIYANEDWSDQDKGQAAMITRMDAGVGELFALLEELQLDDQTIVMFTSDNGHHNEGGHNTKRFDPNGPLRGMKRDLYEGGIRVPFLVRWPGKVPADTTSNHIGYFGDLMATACELAGIDAPPNLDSISFVPEILGRAKQRAHEYLYWEFYERGGKQAVRHGKWKAIRMPMFSGKTQLYDLSADLGEANDIAADHPEVISQLEMFMQAAHTPHTGWKPRGRTEKKQPIPGDGKPRF